MNPQPSPETHPDPTSGYVIIPMANFAVCLLTMSTPSAAHTDFCINKIIAHSVFREGGVEGDPGKKIFVCGS